MPINIDDLNSLMHIGKLQLGVRGPRKRGKRTTVVKRISRPSHTRPWLAQAIKFAEAGREMRGRSFHEVIANVVEKARGTTGGPEAKAARVRTRYAMADAHIASMRAELAGRPIAPPVYAAPALPGLY